MKNLIRKILKEEIDDLSWIDDVPSKKHLFTVIQLKDPGYKQINIYANSIDDLWVEYGNQYEKGYDPFLYSIDGKVLKGYEGLVPEIKKVKNIYESEEDDGLDWIRDVKPTLMTINDFEFFYNKPFIANGITSTIYWIEPKDHESVNVCFKKSGYNLTVTYRKTELIKCFTNVVNYWQGTFI